MARIISVVALVTLAGCTVLARPAAPAQAPRAVLGATAAPAAIGPLATSAPGAAAALTPEPTLAPGAERPRSAPEAAERVARALDALDLAEMRRLMYGGGWQFAYPGEDISLKLLAREAVEWMRRRTPDGRIRAEVDTSQLHATTSEHPAGLVYARSVWTAFDRLDSVPVDIVLTREVDGSWYWSGILIHTSR
jgi:hypothetical protein